MATPNAKHLSQEFRKDHTVSNKNEGYVILLSGTHVTGKETIAFSLAQSLHCPWIKGEAAHAAANFGARAQASRGNGYTYNDVFQRIWLAKMRRLGLEVPVLSSAQSDQKGNGTRAAGTGTDRQEDKPSGSNAGTGQENHKPKGQCLAVITIYATRYPAREAIRSVLAKYSVKPILAILQITKETLGGRTLGAEEAELAERIMREKEMDIERPGESELLHESGEDQQLTDNIREDIIMVESDDGRSVDELFCQILKGAQEIMSC